jgi:prefoldin subunit 5
VTEDDLRAALRAELAPIKAQLDGLRQELATVRAHTDGIPLLGSAIEIIRRDVRLLKAAVNDIGKTNITSGEVEALHDDLDRVQAESMALATRIATLERLISERHD